MAESVTPRTLKGEYRAVVTHYWGDGIRISLCSILVVDADNAWHVRFEVKKYTIEPHALLYEKSHTGLSTALRDYVENGGHIS